MFDEISRLGSRLTTEKMRAGLIKMITPHGIYVEVSPGPGVALLDKSASGSEAVALPERTAKHMEAIQALTDEDISQIKTMNFEGSALKFDELRKSTHDDRAGQVYKSIYLAAHSTNGDGSTWDPSRAGIVAKSGTEIEKARDRLKGVYIETHSLAEIVSKTDSADTFFKFDLGPGTDLSGIAETLGGIKGRFILTAKAADADAFKDFQVSRLVEYLTKSTDHGVGRETVTEAIVVSNFQTVAKAAFDGSAVEVEPVSVPAEKADRIEKSTGGTHAHALDRKGLETAIDGGHEHMFLHGPTDGEIRQRRLFTFLDGSHQHKLSKLDAEKSKTDGGHSHKLRLYDPFDYNDLMGEVLATGGAGAHGHTLMETHSAYDGVHKHTIKLPDGTKLTSTTAGELAGAMLSKSEHQPSARNTSGEGSVSVRTAKGRSFLDVWLGQGQSAMGWGLYAIRGPENVSPGMVAKSFGVDGNQDLHALARGVPAVELGSLDRGIVKAAGKVDGGEIFPVESFEFEHGLHTDHSHEYFLKGAEMCGVLRVRATPEGWNARLCKAALVPDVLSPWAVARGIMPPDGISGLPSGVEKVISPELRYWERSGSEAVALRKALVASGLVTGESTALVDGAIRVVEKSVTGLYQPTATPELSVDWITERLGDLFGGAVAERFTPSDVEKSDGVALALCDLESAPNDELAAQVGLLKALDQDWALVCRDSAEAREILAKAGRAFQIKPTHPGHAAEVSKRLFMASFPIRTAEVKWIDPVPERIKSVAKSETVLDALEALGVEPEIARQVSLDGGTEDEKSELHKAALSSMVERFPMLAGSMALIETEEVSKSADEERFIYGVVLEPETVDTQGDIYNASEIKKAAHSFMAEYRNMGLMHRALVNKGVKILESFLAPSGFSIGKEKVKKGTWVLGVRVLDSALWKKVKGGELTGFSIGGSAVKTPEK